jgi:chemotaxis signal transduction protein
MHPGTDLEDFVTFFIDDQMLGNPILNVRDIFTLQRIVTIPLVSPEVRGSINRHGHIVTVTDVHVRLGLPTKQNGETEGIDVTVKHGNDLYTLFSDRVGDIMGLSSDL